MTVRCQTMEPLTGQRMRTSADGKKSWKIPYYIGNVHRNQEILNHNVFH